jgi:LPS-assembly protein
MRIVFAGVIIALFLPASADAQSMTACKKKDLIAERTNSGVPATATEPAHQLAQGNVILICDAMQLFADEVKYFDELDLVKARGSVTFIDGAQRITAERLEFNMKTRLGTFYNAQGTLVVTGKQDTKSLFGTAEADAYFHGEEIRKTGPDTYVLTNGSFTTCVQPTPRWQVSAGSTTLTLDKHAVMKNAVFRIKDVPVLYLPVMYYPINKEDRSTGFLMPGYGHSRIRGQTLSNAFFWAINRSADATLYHQFTSKTGQDFGMDFRYIEAEGSEGSVMVNVFNGKASSTVLPERSYTIRGDMTQRLPGNLFLRANTNYRGRESLRLFEQSLYEYTDRQRTFAANLAGSFGRFVLGAEAGITDTFDGTGAANRYGSAPRVTFDLTQTPIGQSRVYVGASTEYISLIRQDTVGDPKTDKGLRRFDTSPTIRAPIGSLPFLSIAATASYRFTYWSEQATSLTTQIEKPLTRRLLDIGAEITGPTFTRIFDTPGSRYATRFKHVIQPTASIRKVSAFKDFSKVVRNDGVDMLVGGVTSVSYGLANRILAKRPTAAGPAVAQEIFSVQLRQTYYSDALAAAFDTQYQVTATGLSAPSKFSPVALTASVSPASVVNGSFYLEYDTKHRAIRSTSLGGGVSTSYVNANASWSKQYFIPLLAGFNNKSFLNSALNSSVTLRSSDNAFGATWSWSYDFRLKLNLQQRLTAHYSSQCCGIAAEMQTINVLQFGGTGGQTLDRRFNLSFQLAGIGTFSNLLGSFTR